MTAWGYHPIEEPACVFESAPPDLRLELVRAVTIAFPVLGCEDVHCDVTIRSQDGRVPSEIAFEGDGKYHTGALADEP